MVEIEQSKTNFNKPILIASLVAAGSLSLGVISQKMDLDTQVENERVITEKVSKEKLEEWKNEWKRVVSVDFDPKNSQVIVKFKPKQNLSIVLEQKINLNTLKLRVQPVKSGVYPTSQIFEGPNNIYNRYALYQEITEILKKM